MKTARVLLLVPMLFAFACQSDEPPQPCADPVPAETVELADFVFRPDCLSAQTGATVRLDNTGDAPHTFTVEGTEVDVDLNAGASGEASLSGIEPGLYRVTCTLHPQMVATLRVD